jgi:hypothetical protein
MIPITLFYRTYTLFKTDLSGIPESAGQQSIFIHNAEMRLEAKITAIATDVAARHSKHSIRVRMHSHFH